MTENVTGSVTESVTRIGGATGTETGSGRKTETGVAIALETSRWNVLPFCHCSEYQLPACGQCKSTCSVPVS